MCNRNKASTTNPCNSASAQTIARYAHILESNIMIINNTKPQTVAAILRSIADARSAWENGAYKTSNDQLYQILADDYDVVTQLKTDKVARKELKSYMLREGVSMRAGTCIEAKVIRVTFGAESVRASSYVKVLKVARDEMKTGTNLPTFIHERGGIEEIRRTAKDGISKADQALKNLETAERELAHATPVGRRFKAEASLQPGADASNSYSIALVRKDADGQSAIVWGSGKETLVNAALKEAGKELEQEQANLKVVSDNKQATKKRRSVVKALAKKAAVAKAA